MNIDRSGLIRPNEIDWTSEPDNHLQYKALISSKIHGPDISMTLIKIDGEHLELKTDSSSRIYLLLSGELTFTINSEQTFSAHALDSVYIKRGDRYSFRGKAEYVVINGPAFQAGDDIYSDGVER